MENNKIITCFADLDREQIRIKKRIRKQEEDIKQRIKTLPEDIVNAGISKIMISILNGDFFKSTISMVKTVRNLFSENKKDDSQKGGILNLIKTIVKEKLSS